MRVLHTSDIHGEWDKVFDALEQKFDLWIDTGDFFSNITWANPIIEVPYQKRKLEDAAQKFLSLLGDRPFIYVPGNHDYVELNEVLGGCAKRVQHDSVIELLGHRFAGFREILPTPVRWEGELREEHFVQLMALTLEQKPDILVTHCPPATVLDEDQHGNHWGAIPIRDQLLRGGHTVKHHFFGHIHKQSGGKETRGGITFINGACQAIFHEI